ncbi:hypothetical protein [Acidovorax sp. SUPP3334]|uniref:hypothetical protein n=1 Tax=Acidovorax sp. SUPP3334 TaxID=2920881 RepID=UPI0023DE417E|nr:hypothetical protein [Acidovorax sp. SUPP3334]GKT22981.1 hypothetical protein AVHM3334_10160 [Acidovorax sp. SUPP3334]
MAGLLQSTAHPVANADAIAAEPGTVLLMRHAQTDPGTGDPPGFALGQCSTQRNLSAEGRAQAKRIGVLLQHQGLAPQRVRSSAWCRCLDSRPCKIRHPLQANLSKPGFPSRGLAASAMGGSASSASRRK